MTVFLNGRIHTLDRAQPLVEAVACERGRLVAIGDTSALRRLAATSSDTVDLGARSVVPGLVDAHIHFLSLGLALDRIDLRRGEIAG